MSLRRQETGRRGEAGGNVPGGQDVVCREHSTRRARRVGEPGRRVDRVVHRCTAVRVADDVHVDQIGPAAAEGLVGQPARRREIREEDSGFVPRGGDERRDDLLAFGARDVDGQRPLPFVHPGPEETRTLGCTWPTMVVDAAADGVEADDVGTELSQGHPAEWGGHERRPFHHAQTFEDFQRTPPGGPRHGYRAGQRTAASAP